MKYVNEYFGIGRLATDPVPHEFQKENERPIRHIQGLLAITIKYALASGVRKPTNEFIPFEIFGTMVDDFVAQVGKGDVFFIQGSLHSYTNRAYTPPYRWTGVLVTHFGFLLPKRPTKAEEPDYLLQELEAIQQEDISQMLQNDKIEYIDGRITTRSKK